MQSLEGVWIEEKGRKKEQRNNDAWLIMVEMAWHVAISCLFLLYTSTIRYIVNIIEVIQLTMI